MIVIDQALRAYAYGMSRQLLRVRRAHRHELHRPGARRGVREPQRPTGLFVSTGSGTASATALVLLIVAVVRELLAEGALLGVTILRRVEDGGWYEPVRSPAQTRERLLRARAGRLGLAGLAQRDQGEEPTS